MSVAETVLAQDSPTSSGVSSYRDAEESGLLEQATWGPGPRPRVYSAVRRSRYRNGGRKQRKRVVLKNGDCNVFQTRVSQRRLRYLQDIFTTLVDTKWRWTLLVFALSFILSWLAFAVIWWLIAFTHGDLEPDHLPDAQEDSGWKPCVVSIYNFASCFLFSIETQHTIGYGSRGTTEECPEAIFVMCLQSIVGVMIQAFMVGIIFAKMARPKQRTQTLLFSRFAVVCMRDGHLSLMFRVGDMRKSHIIGATVRAQLIRTRTTKEGEVLSQSQFELEVGTDDGDNNLFFIWPMTVVHHITEESPLYKVSANDLVDGLKGDHFEIVVLLEGTIESTGQTTQARSSYLPSEILWGHRFEPMVSYNKERQSYEVNYSRFNNTSQVDTPLCSAYELADFYKLQEMVHTPDKLYLSDIGSSTSSPYTTITGQTNSCSADNKYNLSKLFCNPALTTTENVLNNKVCFVQKAVLHTESPSSCTTKNSSLQQNVTFIGKPLVQEYRIVDQPLLSCDCSMKNGTLSYSKQVLNDNSVSEPKKQVKSMDEKKIPIINFVNELNNNNFITPVQKNKIATSVPVNKLKEESIGTPSEHIYFQELERLQESTV